MLDTINGLPAHPLFIHIVVVLLPLSAIGMIALVVIPQFRGTVQKYFVASGVVISVIGAFIAKESGAALEQTRGVTDEHHAWGNRTFYLAIALTVVSALWLWLDTKPKSKTKLATGIIVVLVSLAAITSTVLAGDSGAKAVWETRTSEPAAATADPSVDPSVDPSEVVTAIPLSEVALHSSVEDCWTAIDVNVYDLTKWISEHPGGSGPIESLCGIDSTEAFTGQHGGQNKPERELGKYKVGVLG